MYIDRSKMARNCSWASEVEIYAMAHLLHTSIIIFNNPCRCRSNVLTVCDCPLYNWIDVQWTAAIRQAGITVQYSNVAPSLYLYHPPDHYEVVTDIVD